MDSFDSHMHGIAPYSEKDQFCPYCGEAVLYRTNVFLMCRCGKCNKLFGESKIVRR